ncbi:membrane protein insertase YidC [Syntrophotalea acetylenica]|jgi:YidC/Oxa1 family membrane protein insertase|uniref:membrane protein insertase YidC n=1 Tax=Syntrophotalea TaxID=2812025 RepID=UPI002A36A2EB|nr:membrane protein insertase YidC [Syntrophotalea acetylenica]MDY0261717.1 membrane protein insertase YidC [Syntrophotalea acetylenica]
MENKNVLMALVLMLAVWTGYSMFFAKPAPQENGQNLETVADNKSSVSSLNDIVAEKSPVSERVLAADNNKILPLDIVVETEDFRAVFTNIGARLKNLELKHYKQTMDSGSALVSLVDAQSETNTFDTFGTGDISIPADHLYAVDISDANFVVGSGEKKQLRFYSVLNKDLIIEKTYYFKGNGYDLELEVNLYNKGKDSKKGNLAFMLVQPWDDDREISRYSFVGPALYKDGEVVTHKIKSIIESPVKYSEKFEWTAFEEKYFMIAAVPLDGNRYSLTIDKTNTSIRNTIDSESIKIDPDNSYNQKFMLYCGPRDLDILKSINYNLDKAINFGFFDMLARPLLSFLKFFYNNIIQNYGVAIILLTVFIKILFWPLTHKSYKSMRDMQRLQPEMQRLREKFKKDKEKLNREIMELYRKNRVNPMGGCLPMFAQIPVFFALYKVLLESIALRHEPFIFWIQDLSAKDPYYITPVIMGVTMFIQQKMSPTSMDSQQAKIMLFMPVIFTFMFLNFPSGLVIYWLVNNLLTILQQWTVNRGASATIA